MSAASIEILKKASVATLATALYKRGLRNQVIQDVHPVGRDHGKKSVPGASNMVGPAFTLRYMPAREDRNTLAEFQNPQHPQRQAIEQCPAGHVLVMDSRKDARAASAGDILITRLMMRGAAGVVTDGGFRDSDSIAELDMPAYHHRPASPTNLTLHEAIDINVPIGCGDAAVFPGDYIVGDNFATPEKDDKNFTEKVYRFKDIWCTYSRSVFNDLKLKKKINNADKIIFGCFQRPEKITSKALK
ncbi:MAG: hypothetical protein ACPG70_04225, partial [Candidatus Puniceispirillaceae bacterium]